MKRNPILVAAFTAFAFATSAFAEATVRPMSRADQILIAKAAEHARLSELRVSARPGHMVRHPVEIETAEPDVRPLARSSFLPNTRWSHKTGSDVWTRAAMISVAAHGDGLDELVPKDIATWCPAYEVTTEENRRAFWVGMMSALSKHESTYNPNAVGGGNRWFGLLQIYPPTARGYGCRPQTGDALKDPVENLSCAARIMNVTVARDNAIAVFDGRWRGVAADWGPMSNRSKIAEMSAWTRQQSYCRLPTRPELRPENLLTSSMQRPAARQADATISAMDVVLPEEG